MYIKRDKLTSALDNFFDRKFGVVFGSPGAGKSYTIQKVCEERIKDKKLTILLPVDQFINGTQEEFCSVLETKEDPINFLREIGKSSIEYNIRPIVVFDGLDAARNSEAESNFISFISNVKRELVGWGVYASIRQFDLLKNDEIKKIFSVTDLSISDNVFEIPQLTMNEIEEGLKEQIAKSPNLLESLDSRLIDILNTPFNLWLFSELLNKQSIDNLSKITAEIELLDLYHKTVVGLDKKSIKSLEYISTKMVDEGTLTIEMKNDLNVDKLLSNEIVGYSTLGNNRIRFSHNIFFDYYVSLYCLGNSNKEFFKYISEDYKRPIFLQHSIRYFFFRLWISEREQYINALKDALKSKDVAIQLLGKTIAFTPIVFNLNSVDEIDSFIDDKSNRAYFLKFLTYGLKQFPEANKQLRVELLAKIIASDQGHAYWNSIVSICQALDVDDFLDKHELISNILLGEYNKLLTVKNDGNMDFLRVYWILPGLIKTLPHKSSEKSDVIYKILETIGKEGYSVKEVYKIASLVNEVIEHIPSTAVDIYKKIFSFEESRNDAVAMGTPIMPLQSNLKQDYNMSFYQLFNSFSYFYETNLFAAFEAAVFAGTGEIFRKHNPDTSRTFEFDFNGKKLVFIEDFSHVWGTGSKVDDYGVMIVDSIFSHLETVIESDNRYLDKVIEKLAVDKLPVYFLTKLIELASKYPIYFKSFIPVILQNVDFLRDSYDGYYICRLLESSFEHLDDSDKKRVEESILSMVVGADKDRLKYIEEDLKAYLNVVDLKYLQINDAIQIKKGIKDNEVRMPRLNTIEVGWSNVSREERLSERGLDPEDKKVLKFADTLDELVELCKDKGLADDKLPFLKSKLLDARKLYDSANTIELKNKFLEDYLDCLNSCIFRIKDWTQDELVSFCKFLIEGSSCLKPEFDEKYHSNFNQPHWSPTAKTESAQFVCKLGVLIDDKTEIYKVIKKLYSDRVPSVRYLLLSELFRVHYYNPDLFWEIVNDVKENEPHRSIKLITLHSVGRIFRKDEDKAERIFAETFDVSEKDEYSRFFARTVVELCALNIGSFGEEKVKELVANPEKYKNITTELVNSFLAYIFNESKDNYSDESSSRSFDALRVFFNSCQNILLKEKDYTEELKPIYSTISELVLRTYFASEDKVLSQLNEGELKIRIGAIFEIVSWVDSYVSKGGFLDPHTLYELNKLAYNIIDFDPVRSIQLVYNSLLANKDGGYRSDSNSKSSL